MSFNHQQFNDYLERIFTVTNLKPIVSIVPIEPNEDGYGPYKMLDEDGRIRGYCGDKFLEAISKYKLTK